MSAFSPRDLLSSSPREPLRSAWKYVSFHSLICINFSHYTRKWPHVSPAQSGGPGRPAAAYHGRRRRHQLPRSPLPASFQAGWRPLTGPARPAGPRPPQLDLLAVTEPPPAAAEGGAPLSRRLSRCHGKARGEWFSVASDFQYLFGIRPTYLREKKQHVEGKWQAETRSLAPPFSPRSVFKQGGPITLKAPDQPHSIIAANPYSSIK